MKKGAKKQKKAAWAIVGLFGVAAGLYLLINTLSPLTASVMTSSDATAKKLVKTEPVINDDRLYVPKVNIDVAIVPTGNNETLALEKGAVNRSPASGNPKDGGNFVIAAHRFNLGLTPNQTRARSPFYHIDKLDSGDEIYVDYKGTRYVYKVTERKNVPPTAVEIEQRTDENQLTMYSCELSGPKAGREVIIAKPQGTVVWTDGTPKIKSL